MDDEFLMREIVAALVTDTAQQIEKLTAALSRNAAEECVRLAHSARGACGNVGATAMWALFSAIEADAKNGDLDQCRARMPQVSLEFEKLRLEASNI